MFLLFNNFVILSLQKRGLYMVRIWVKIEKNQKVKKSLVYEKFEVFDVDKMFDYAVEICQILDIETPIILSKHKSHFEEFGVTSFNQSDFINNINFDKLVFEDIS